MDLTTIVLPGAQSMVTAILTDSWAQARTAIARLWASRHPEDSPPEPSLAELEQANRELDIARMQAIQLAGSGSDADRAARMQLFWAGYLAGQLCTRPELADVIQALPALIGGIPTAPAPTETISNTITGTVHGSTVQAGDISGGIHFGRS